MSRRIIEVEIVGDASKLKRALGDADSSSSKFGGTMSKLAKVGAPVAAGLGVAVAAGARFVKAAEESNRVSRQTDAVIRSTGGTANVTAKQVDQLSNAISKKGSVDDEVVKSGANMLLTFTNVRNEVGKGNDIFNRATHTLADMSAATGVAMPKAAVQLGKALNDPIKGISALSRVGVQFTDQQREQIKTMVKAGDTAGAQKIILRELGKEFGGSAAAGKSSSKDFAIAIGNLEEKIGKALLPVVNKVVPKITAFVEGMTDGTGSGGKFARIVKGIAELVGDNLVPAFTRAAKVVNATLIPPLRNIIGVLNDVYRAASAVVNIIGKIPGAKALGRLTGLIDRKAAGGYSHGGLTLVGEEGPELVSLPGGAYVHTARQTGAMAASSGGSVVQHFHGPVGSQRAARVMGETLAYRLAHGSA